MWGRKILAIFVVATLLAGLGNVFNERKREARADPISIENTLHVGGSGANNYELPTPDLTGKEWWFPFIDTHSTRIYFDALYDQTTVFIDSNYNGVLDDGETSTIIGVPAPYDGTQDWGHYHSGYFVPPTGKALRVISDKPIQAYYWHHHDNAGIYDDSNYYYSPSLPGTDFIVPYDKGTVYIGATQSDTTISIDGVSHDISSAGDIYSFNAYTGAKITSDKPVCVVVIRDNYGTNSDETWATSLLPTSYFGSEFWIPNRLTHQYSGVSSDTRTLYIVYANGNVETQTAPTSVTKITTDTPATIYYLFDVHANDPWDGMRHYTHAFNVFPTSFLGNTYICAGWIISTHDNNVVQIDIDYDGVIDDTVTLHSGDMYNIPQRYTGVHYQNMFVKRIGYIKTTYPVLVTDLHIKDWDYVDEATSAFTFLPISSAYGEMVNGIIKLTDNDYYDAGPSIIKDSLTGEYYLVWTSNRSGNYDIWFKKSTDLIHWSEPINMAPHPWRDVSPHITIVPNGDLLVTFSSTRGGPFESWGVWLTRSTDKGETWSTPTRLVNEWGGDSTIFTASDGSIYVAYHSGNGNYPNEVYKSTDNGYSWIHTATVNKHTPAVDPQIIEEDGKLYLVYDNRMRQPATPPGDLFFYESTDGGYTWNEIGAIVSPYDVYLPTLVKSNGKYICVWFTNRGASDKKNIFYSISYDMHTWQSPKPLLNSPSYWDTLPYLFKDDDGELYLLWSSDRDGDMEIYLAKFNDLLQIQEPDLAIFPDDISFSRKGDLIEVTANIHNYGFTASNVAYWIVDVYNNKETIVASGTISSISYNGVETVTKTINLQGSPENHKIKVIVDPNNAIDESDEGNNVAEKDVRISDWYILTSARMDDGILYYVKFKPTSYISPSETISKYNNDDESFIDGIEKVKVTTEHNPDTPITDGELIGKIYYEILEKFIPIEPVEFNHWDDPIFLSHELQIKLNWAQSIDFLNTPEWLVNQLTKIPDEEKRIRLWGQILIGSANKNKPRQNWILNWGTAFLGIVTLGLKCKYYLDAGEAQQFVNNLNTDTYHEYTTKGFIIKPIEYEGNMVKKYGLFMDLETAYGENPKPIAVAYLVGTEWSPINPDFGGFTQFLNEAKLGNIVTTLFKETHKSIVSLYEIQQYVKKTSISTLNRLQITYDVLKSFYGKNENYNDFLEAFEGVITELKIYLYNLEIDQNPTKNEISYYLEGLMHQLPSILTKAALKTATIWLLTKASVKICEKYLHITTISFGSLGCITVSGIASGVSAFWSGWSLGLLFGGWDNMKRHMEIAKVSTDLGLYVLETPTYILSSECYPNVVPFYYNTIDSMRCRLFGYGWYNRAEAMQDYLLGIGDIPYGIVHALGLGENPQSLRKRGAFYYNLSDNIEERNVQFKIFNDLSSRTFGISGAEIKPPSLQDLESSFYTFKISDSPISIGLNNEFETWVNIIVTKIGNKYAFTIDPFERQIKSAIGIRGLGIHQVFSQNDGDSGLSFELFSSIDESIHYESFYYTNCFYNTFHRSFYFNGPKTIVIDKYPQKLRIYVYKRGIYQWLGYLSIKYWPGTFFLGGHLDNKIKNQKIYREGLSLLKNLSDISWDSDNDGKNDAINISWDLTDYQYIGNGTIVAMVNDSNGSTVDMYVGHFPISESNYLFNFSFYATKNDEYGFTLRLLNQSLDLVYEENISGVYLYKGSGPPQYNETITNLTYLSIDSDGDDIDDEIQLSLSINLSREPKNRSLFIICYNSSNVLIDTDHKSFNSSNAMTNYSYSFQNLNANNYWIEIYLSDSNHRVADSRRISVWLGKRYNKTFGEYKDYGNDTNGDGLFDYLSIAVNVSVNQTGTYTLKGYLRNESGEYLGLTQTSSILSRGLNTVVLNFNSSLITLNNEKGHFCLSGVALYDANFTVLSASSPYYYTTYYNSSDFKSPPLQLTGYIMDQGNDSNDDGYFDFLEITVGININSPDNYSFVAYLTNGSGNMLTTSTIHHDLIVGNYNLTIKFDGTILYSYLKNTTYTLSYIEVFNSSGNFLGSLRCNYTTLFYNYSSFQSYKCITDEYLEQCIDEDNDGLYDYLSIDVGVNITIPGNYTIEGDLYSSDSIFIDHYAINIELDKGNHYASLPFKGMYIYFYGINSSYTLKNLKITCYTTNLSITDRRENAYNTSVYYYTQFNNSLAGGCYGVDDRGIDEDLDGLYDYLEVLLNISVNIFANYTIKGYLYNSSGIFLASASNQSVTNISQISLKFLGQIISDSKSNGPYNLSYLEIYDEKGNLVYSDTNVYITSAYNYTDFEPMLKPDLNISTNDIVFSDNSPVVGETVYINVTIHNIGNTNATGIVIGFYDNISFENLTLISNEIIPILNASEEKIVSISWEPDPGWHNISVIVDEVNNIYEENELNNVAYKELYVNDLTPPIISSLKVNPPQQEAGKYVNVSCIVVDRGVVNTVRVNLINPNGISSNFSMSNIFGTDIYYYNATYTLCGQYTFFIWTSDTGNNEKTTNTYQFVIEDTIPPKIRNVATTPVSQLPNECVNISCEVYDAGGIENVCVNITYPDESNENISMNKVVVNDIYYYNTTYSLEGTYHYLIWARDTNGNINVSAVKTFTILSQQYNLNISVSPSGSGSITLNPSGGTYDYGTVVTLTAVANAGYQFDHWSGDVSGNNPTIQITMDSDKNITAHFKRVSMNNWTEDFEDGAEGWYVVDGNLTFYGVQSEIFYEGESAYKIVGKRLSGGHAGRIKYDLNVPVKEDTNFIFAYYFPAKNVSYVGYILEFNTAKHGSYFSLFSGWFVNTSTSYLKQYEGEEENKWYIHCENIYNDYYNAFGTVPDNLSIISVSVMMGDPYFTNNEQTAYFDDIKIGNFILPNQRPYVAITSPKEGEIVSGLIEIQGKAWDEDGNGTLQKVEVRIDDGEWQNATGTLNWAYALDTKKLENGNHTIYTRSYDGKEYSNIVSISIEVKNKKGGGGIPGFELIALLAAVMAVAWIRKRAKKKEK